jgi:hypothetical protein
LGAAAPTEQATTTIKAAVNQFHKRFIRTSWVVRHGEGNPELIQPTDCRKLDTSVFG